MRFWLLLALCACGSPDAVKSNYWGEQVQPPRGLGKIRPGMSVTEAKALFPELHTDKKSVRDELKMNPDGDVQLEVKVDSSVVVGIRATIQGHAAQDDLTRAWGPPQIGRDALGQHETAWVSDVTGWKAKLDCLEEPNCQLDFFPYHELTADLFGTHVVPPGDLAKLRIGMAVAEARLLAPSIVDVRNGLPAGFENVKEYVAVDDKTGAVRSIYLSLPQFVERVIEEAWGPGESAVDLDGKNVMVWHDPATRWRATLRDSMGTAHDLYFENYVPAAQLFGDQPEGLDGLPEPLLGRTVEEVKAAYRGDVSMQGKELVVVLPPTEWERTATRFTLELAGGKVKQINFSISWKSHPVARDTLLELFNKKWGEPHRIEEGEGKPWALVFRDEGPRVEVREDVDRGMWRFELK